MSKATYTASQISDALGMSRAAVHRALEGVNPCGTQLVANNPTAAWSVGRLPGKLRERIHSLQRARGNITAEQVLVKEPAADWWKLALPLSRIHSSEIAAAQKLQAALRRALALPGSVTMKQREQLAAADYQTAFGRTVSDRYLRKLIARTIERDGGRGQLDRLELFLPEKPHPSTPLPSLRARCSVDFEALQSHFHGCQDRGNPSASDIAYCWRGVVSFWQDQVKDGGDAGKLRATLLDWLEATLPRLGKTRAAMSRNLDRKLAAAQSEGTAAILDRRAEKSGHRRRAPQWEENIDKLVRVSAAWGDRIGQAWHGLFEGTAPGGEQFTESFRAYFSSYNPSVAKGRVPTSVLAAVRARLEAANATKRKSGRGRRDWSDVMAGDGWTSDDVTQNHYFYHWCDDGEFVYEGQRFNLTRGQLLPVIDEGTDYPLGFALIPQRSYNSRHILTLMARICMNPEIGLPHRRFVLERGIWKALKLANALVGWQERVSTGFLKIGRELRIHHARSAEGKGVVENYIGRLQNAMQHLRGYAGRNEKVDCPEGTRRAKAMLKSVNQPLKADRDPSKDFLSYDQLAQEIEPIMRKLSQEQMRGRRHKGPTPEHEWKTRRTELQKVLPDSLRHLLFTEVKELTVQPEGLFLKIGGDELQYSGSERLGEMIREKVRVRFNPELPESVTVCHLRGDPKELNPFAVPLKKALPARTATNDQFEEKRRHERALNKHGEMIIRTMRPTWNATVCDTSRIAPDVLASGEAHRKIENKVIELRYERGRVGAELQRIGASLGLEIDASKSKTPRADLDRARRSAEREERLRRREAEEGTTASPQHSDE